MGSIYLAHAVAATERDHRARTHRWVAWIRRYHADAVIVAPWLYEVYAFGGDDKEPALREDALQRCIGAARLCDEVWLVGGQTTDGMRREAQGAHVVLDLTALGPEPPGAST